MQRFKIIMWTLVVLLLMASIWSLLFIYIPIILRSFGYPITISDTINAISSIFTALAFAGIIFTVFLQRDELALQRQELVFTRRELERTASAQEKSETALGRQVRSMQITAELNALNSLISVYSVMEGRDSLKRLQYMHKREHCEKRLEALLKMLQDESINSEWVLKDKPSFPFES